MLKWIQWETKLKWIHEKPSKIVIRSEKIKALWHHEHLNENFFLTRIGKEFGTDFSQDTGRQP